MPTPRSAHDAGSIEKPAYPRLWASKATKHAAAAAVPTDAVTPVNRTIRARTMSATYTTRPIAPCSAPTVIGSACETTVLAHLISLQNALPNDPEPQPQTGRFRASVIPPCTRLTRPLENLLRLCDEPDWVCAAPPAAKKMATQ